MGVLALNFTSFFKPCVQDGMYFELFTMVLLQTLLSEVL